MVCIARVGIEILINHFGSKGLGKNNYYCRNFFFFSHYNCCNLAIIDALKE